VLSSSDEHCVLVALSRSGLMVVFFFIGQVTVHETQTNSAEAGLALQLVVIVVVHVEGSNPVIDQKSGIVDAERVVLEDGGRCRLEQDANFELRER